MINDYDSLQQKILLLTEDIKSFKTLIKKMHELTNNDDYIKAFDVLEKLQEVCYEKLSKS